MGGFYVMHGGTTSFCDVAHSISEGTDGDGVAEFQQIDDAQNSMPMLLVAGEFHYVQC
ncbi:MAG: hypothetical protein M2R45_01636 [Verrucomicrobia subdivision 3 bacterium]|nr:hypothetical protein [Limisphaerales bacterium]MCS1412787.1 hypothetical protein [Limisphaerales bacterium]